MKLSFNVTLTTGVAPGTALIVPGVAVAVPAVVAIDEIVVRRFVAVNAPIVKMLAVSAVDEAVQVTENLAPSTETPSASVTTVAAGAHLRSPDKVALPSTPVIAPRVSVTIAAAYEAVAESYVEPT